MAVAGPNNPGTAADGGGSYPWTTPENAVSSNDSYATKSNGSMGSTCNYLKTTNYGFAIPAGATIDGIVVSIERHANQSDAEGNAVDNEVKIIKSDGTIGTTNKATTTKWPLNTDGVANYGSSTDKWDVEWLPADINDVDFGVALKKKNTGDTDSTIGYIDLITITIYYTEAVSGPANLKTVNGLAKLSCKSVNGLLLASVKTWDGLA